MDTITAFIQAHPLFLAALSAFVVGLLDLLFAINPSLSSNGILHALYVWVSSKKSGTTPPPAP